MRRAVKLYRLRTQDISRICSRFPARVKCYNCPRELGLGDTIVSKRVGKHKRRYYCPSCARRLLLVD